MSDHNQTTANLLAPVRRVLRQAVAWRAALMVMLGLALGPVAVAGVADAWTKGDQIKAAFVYNILKFVEWPADRFDGGEAPIVIGVLSDDARKQLELIVQQRRINGRPVVVRQVSDLDDIRSTHML